MSLFRSGVCIVGLLVSSAPLRAVSQLQGDPRIEITEAQRAEILKAERSLTRETFPQTLARAEAGELAAQVLVGLAYLEGFGIDPESTGRRIRRG